LVWKSQATQLVDKTGPLAINRLSGSLTKRRILMLWTIIVILLILWLLGFFGGNISSSIPKTGNWIHILVVIAVILLILKLLGMI
jgi:uncharacterized membrane protein